MDHANTASTVLNEQSQNPAQAGKASTSVSKDVGQNMGQETSGADAGGGLDARLDQADMARPGEFAGAKAEDNSVKVGTEGGVDAHEAAAGKQP